MLAVMCSQHVANKLVGTTMVVGRTDADGRAQLAGSHADGHTPTMTALSSIR